MENYIKIFVGLSVLILIIIFIFFIKKPAPKPTKENLQKPPTGHIQVVPETIKTDDTNLIGLILHAPINSEPINPRFTNILLNYRLIGENNYKSAKPTQAPLSKSDIKLVTEDKQYIKYNFSLDLYPKGTTGEIEYYIKLSLDNKPMQIEGIKKIKLAN